MEGTLKERLIDAKVKAALANGIYPLDTSDGSLIEREAEYMKETLIDFLTECEFRVTELKAPVVIEDFKMPPQPVNIELKTLLGDKAPILDMIRQIPGAAPLVDVLEAKLQSYIEPLLEGGATVPEVSVEKESSDEGVGLMGGLFGGSGGGGLESTGYVYIGEDPDSQDEFNVDDEDGQRQFTTVKLFREDIEDIIG